jgi:uncharacterized repeat protein (TIGR03803 family)
MRAPSDHGYRVIYSFAQPPDGYGPVGALTSYEGLLYGTTYWGGSALHGTIFSITTTGEERVIYSFRGSPDGANPYTNLVLLRGSLYGTTYGGGRKHRCTNGYGCGTVFASSGSGNERVVYTFTGHQGSAYPQNGLLALAGKFYGTTPNTPALGTVFVVTRAGQERTLYKFKGNLGDGAGPTGMLATLGGKIYGVTSFGGTSNAGTVFELTTAGSERVIHNFGLAGGSDPMGGLVAYKGTLYGATTSGGPHKRGAVFALTPDGRFHVLYAFREFPKGDGEDPNTEPIVVDGAVYGTTYEGGAHGNGTIYKVTTSGNETILHSFGPPPDGLRPSAALTEYDGDLYGTTAAGGSGPGGTVFTIRP